MSDGQLAIGQLAELVTSGDARAMHRLYNEAGARRLELPRGPR